MPRARTLKKTQLLPLSATTTAPAVDLVAFSVPAAFSRPAQSSDLPTEILVCPWGERDIVLKPGRIVCNETTVAQLPANNQARRWDTIALDFNHNTLRGRDETESQFKAREPIPVAAHGVPEVRPGEGIFLTNLEWTDKGTEFAAGGHLKDISPTVTYNQAGEVTGLHSVALCRNGQIADLRFFSLPSEPEDVQKDNAPLKENAKPNETDTDQSKMKKELIAILAALSVDVPDPETIEDAAVIQLATAQLKKIQTEKLVLAAPLSTTEEKEGNPEIVALSTRLEVLESERGLEARRALIRTANASGRVLPLSDETLLQLSVPVLEEMISKAPKVPQSKLPAGRPAAGADGKPQRTAEEEEQRVALGISEEAWEKFADA